MNFLSYFLLILLLSHLFHHSALAMRKLEDFGIDKARESSMDLDDQDTPFIGGDYHFKRKELHEVHSGPNPISNSVPKKRLKTILRRIIP
ncbi:Uncharacterized protein TCM_032170 [Theobroma cacao]|uniref:Uncharacterized protein n=1 Tax=Theobroma cacao TaxID=3641 RepID=A0A061FA28_THECC|nr:Uncharacterized protein TCM_032170 [Theobroma cacao]